MARRYCGSVKVVIAYRDRGDYTGVVVAGERGEFVWQFAELDPPACGFGPGVGYDSAQAYDRMAAAAISFGAYYTTHNRADAPSWAPPAEVADAIAEGAFVHDDGEPAIRRRRACPRCGEDQSARTQRSHRC
jgi:hypothetical protein